METFKQFIVENYEKSKHHKVAVDHGYRVGTKVGTAGYYTVGGGFTHVYYHPRTGDELHVHSKNGATDKWAHVSEDGQVHRTGVDHNELLNHFSAFHPEVAEKKKKEKMDRIKEKNNTIKLKADRLKADSKLELEKFKAESSRKIEELKTNNKIKAEKDRVKAKAKAKKKAK